MSEMVKYERPAMQLSVERARDMLAEAMTTDVGKSILDVAKAMAYYAKEKNSGREAQAIAVEIVLRSERRMGELLRDSEKAKGAMGIGKKCGPPEVPHSAPTLKEQGITKNESSKYQKLAALPEKEFEEKVAEVRANVRAWKPRDAAEYERVRKLTEEGWTPADIERETKIPQDRVRHFLRKGIRPKRVLAGAIEDAEVFAESWASRASNMDTRWLEADLEEKNKLIDALRACRASVNKVIQRLNNEAKKDKTNDEVDSNDG